MYRTRRNRITPDELKMIRISVSRSRTRTWMSILIVISINLIAVAASLGKVVVFDGVTTVQTPIRIQVLTKGRLFAEGGRLVDIYLNEKHLKKIMTGGDGYGYLKYVPEVPGIKTIKARTESASSSGLLLVMRPSEKAIVIDIEGAFKDAIFSQELRANSQEAVRSLSKNYTIIYLSRMVGKGISRSWLEEEGFPKSVILRWRGATTFKSLSKRGINLHAVIGSTAVMSAAKKHIEHRYTFEKSKDAVLVQSWDEILKHLQPAVPDHPPQRNPVSGYQWTEVGCQK